LDLRIVSELKGAKGGGLVHALRLAGGSLFGVSAGIEGCDEGTAVPLISEEVIPSSGSVVDARDMLK
jgi:hypothetical protein